MAFTVMEVTESISFSLSLSVIHVYENQYKSFNHALVAYLNSVKVTLAEGLPMYIEFPSSLSSNHTGTDLLTLR